MTAPHHVAGPVWAYRCSDGWRVGRLQGEPPAWAPLAKGAAHSTRRAAVRAYWAALHAGPCGGRP